MSISKSMNCPKIIYFIGFILLTLQLVGCTHKKKSNLTSKKVRYTQLHDGAPLSHHIPDLHKITDAIPKFEPLSRYGNPSSYMVSNKTYKTLSTSKHYKKTGLASWYGTKFHGQRTSSGEPYDMFGMTAAHCTLPVPTYAQVTNLDNGKKVIVKINDRGPFHSNRLIDLSYTAAAKLGILGTGVGRVEVKSVDPRDHHTLRLAKNALKEDKKTASLTKPTALHTYLQLGAFSEKMNAKSLLQKVEKLSGYSGRISHSPRQGIFRVQLGPIKNDEEAITLTKKLAVLKFPEAVIISE